MGHDVKVTAKRSDGQRITDRLTAVGMTALAYHAWPESQFAELVAGEELTDFTEDYETHTRPVKKWLLVRVKETKPVGDGRSFVVFEVVS